MPVHGPYEGPTSKNKSVERSVEKFESFKHDKLNALFDVLYPDRV